MNKKIQKEIKKIRDIIVKKYQPEKIILFGSAASGQYHPNADIDLLVIKKGVERLKRQQRCYQLNQILPHNIAMDILVYTPYEIKKRLYLEDPFIKKILNRGKVLYGS